MAKAKRKIENSIPTLKSGITGDFWRILCHAIDDAVIDYEKELHSDALMKLPPGEYKFRNELIKAKIKNLKKLKGLPESLIASNGVPDTDEEDFDPYERPEVNG